MVIGIGEGKIDMVIGIGEGKIETSFRPDEEWVPLICLSPRHVSKTNPPTAKLDN